MRDHATEARYFGVEEEYLLLDSRTGVPVDRAAELIRATPEVSGQAEREYFSSQLETATPVCRDADAAEQALMRFRTAIFCEAEHRGIVFAGTGLPPAGGELAGTVTPKPRYQRIETEMRSAAERQYATGTHVHVEVPSRDIGVEVLARMARWAPALLAMTANSPLWCGEPTGFASWRHVMGLAWPIAGYPQGFADGNEYNRSVAQLIGTGVTPDSGLLPWVARLSDRYPTIELRIADSQLEARDAVSYAVIVRALVDRAIIETESGAARPRYAPPMVNGAIWMAARNGLSAEIIDPLVAEAVPAFDLIERMLCTIEGELDRFADRVRVESFVRRLRESGGPAARQLESFEAGGIGGVLELYRRCQAVDHAALVGA